MPSCPCWWDVRRPEIHRCLVAVERPGVVENLVEEGRRRCLHSSVEEKVRIQGLLGRRDPKPTLEFSLSSHLHTPRRWVPHCLCGLGFWG